MRFWIAALLFASHAAHAHKVPPPLESAAGLPWQVATVPAGEEGRLLRTFRVGPERRAYAVSVPACAEKIEAVRLRVHGATVFVESFGVVFTDGQQRQFSVNQRYNTGVQSPWLRLGMLRLLDSRCPAQVFALANAEGGTATVEIFAIEN